MVVVYTIAAVVPEKNKYNAWQTFYTFEYLYIKGNNIFSNRISMQNLRQITIQHV